MKTLTLSIATLLLTLVACNLHVTKQSEAITSTADILAVQDPHYQREEMPMVTMPKKVSKLEKHLLAAGLVDIQEEVPAVAVDLRYSSADNFLHEDVYGGLEKCYVQKDVADKIAIAQAMLQAKFPFYKLVLFDGVRPRSVQQKMWNSLDIPINEKGQFLSNPAHGSVHQYGAAVDVSIVDESGEELDMGTPFDYIGEMAHTTNEFELLDGGELTEQQLKNRMLLRYCMVNSGFRYLETEWWHFNSCSRKAARQKYHPIE